MIPEQRRQDTEQEYAFSLVTQIKLNEKLLAECEADAEKWRKRAALARNSGGNETRGSGTAEALAAEAEARAAASQSKAAALQAENAELRAEAEKALRALLGLAARERSVDPDLLLQELLIAAGHNPGEEQELGRERKFAELEKDAAADAALAELKAKMAGSAGVPGTGAGAADGKGGAAFEDNAAGNAGDVS
jgi:phage shock protein A